MFFSQRLASPIGLLLVMWVLRKCPQSKAELYYVLFSCLKTWGLYAGRESSFSLHRIWNWCGYHALYLDLDNVINQWQIKYPNLLGMFSRRRSLLLFESLGVLYHMQLRTLRFLCIPFKRKHLVLDLDTNLMFQFFFIS